MAYPITLDFKRQAKSSSLWALLTIIPLKFILLIPYFVVLWVLMLVSMVVGLLGAVAVLFTGEYPRSLENFMLGVLRWTLRIPLYVACLTDKYPPFTMGNGKFPLTINFTHQKKNSRLMALLTIIPVKFILLIPHFFILCVMDFLSDLSMFVGLFAVLFTGKFPKPLEHVVIAYMRYFVRLFAYAACLTDKYPPLSWERD